MSNNYIHLENAAKEVKSVKAQREIAVVQIAVKELAKQLHRMDRDDMIIKQAICELRHKKHAWLRKKLHELL